MADLGFEISAQLLAKLAQIPDNDEPIDFEALGIDSEGIRQQLQKSLEAQLNTHIQSNAEFLSAFDIFHPVFVVFYSMLLIAAIIAIRAQSKWPAIVMVLFSIFWVGLSDFINAIAAETIGQMSYLFERNPFDASGIFFMISLAQPVLFFALAIIIGRVLVSLFSRCLCSLSTRSIGSKKTEDKGKDGEKRHKKD